MSNYKLKIKEYRNLRELTQKELAGKVGISRSYLSEIENGKYNIKVELLFKISRILEVCPHKLIGYNCKYNCADYCQE